MSPIFRPGKPGWLAHIPNDVSLAAGFQPITTWSLDWSEGGTWNGTGGMQVDKPGTYLCVVQTRRDTVASTSNVFPRLLINGTQVWAAPGLNTTAASMMALTAVVRLDAGDVVSADVRLHTTISATLTASSSYFAGLHLGPERWT